MPKVFVVLIILFGYVYVLDIVAYIFFAWWQSPEMTYMEVFKVYLGWWLCAIGMAFGIRLLVALWDD